MTTISTAQDKTSLLRSALLGNAIFSFLSGLDFLLFSRPIAEFLGIPSPTVILILGVSLLAYGVLLYVQSRKEPLSTSFAWFAIIADVLWVLGSIDLIFFDPVGFSTAGKWAIAIIADIVLVFAVVQYIGLRRMTKG